MPSRWMRRGRGTLYRKLSSLDYLVRRDRAAIVAFLRARYPVALPLGARVALVARFVATTNHLRAYHSQAEMLTVADRILRLAGRPGLTVVECGCGKGASTAKLSLVTRLAGGRLLAYDSFRGIPPNDEVHTDLLGRRMGFRAGAFRGRLREVQAGNTGAQAMAVTLRGMATGQLERVSAGSLAMREATLGALNGFVVGLIAAAAMLALVLTTHSDQAVPLATAVFGAGIASYVIGGVAGALVPLALRRLGADPATASTVILTTITDVISMALLLGGAAWLLR